LHAISCGYLPAQVIPSPEYPVLQAQVKLPGVLVQAALVSHVSVIAVHSSSSIKRKNQLLLFVESLKLLQYIIQGTSY